MLIGLSQQTDKLVFVRSLLSLRASALKWRGNPPVERSQVTITAKNRGDFHAFRYYSVHFPSIRGIATTSVRYSLAMTALFFKHQFITLFSIRPEGTP